MCYKTSRVLQVSMSLSGRAVSHNGIFLMFSGASAEEIEDNAVEGIRRHIARPIEVAALARAQELERLAGEIDQQ